MRHALQMKWQECGSSADAQAQVMPVSDTGSLSEEIAGLGNSESPPAPFFAHQQCPSHWHSGKTNRVRVNADSKLEHY